MTYDTHVTIRLIVALLSIAVFDYLLLLSTHHSQCPSQLSTAPNGSNISGGFTPPNTPELKLK
jgi:hypothetical protein